MNAYLCPVCGYVYDEEAGHPESGLAPGVPWSEVPEDWTCPECAVRKPEFVPAEF